MNHYSRLFRYRQRPNREPLEDFITEALADLLTRDDLLAQAFLNEAFEPDEAKTERTSLRIETQKFLGDEGRADLFISWHELGRRRSLLIENKANSLPWTRYGDKESHSDDQEHMFESQIENYCKYQDRNNSDAVHPDHFVLLVSPNLILGFEKGALLGKFRSNPYLGNKRWRAVAVALMKVENPGTVASDSFQLVREFIRFLEEEEMTGFENFLVADLAANIQYEKYDAKRYGLAAEIHANFVNQFEVLGKITGMEVSNVDASGHIGIVLVEKGVPPSNSSVWIFVGLSTWRAKPKDFWPNLTLSHEKIPDVEVMLGLFSINGDPQEFARKYNFEKGIIRESVEFQFVTVYSGKGFVLVYRKPLISFLTEENQLDGILKFLRPGVELMMDSNTGIHSAIRSYFDSRN